MKSELVEVKSIAVQLTPLRAIDVATLLLQQPAQRPTLVLNHNLHSIYLFHRLDWFRRLYERASLVLVDGWPVLKLLEVGSRRRYGHEYRIGSTDWLHTLQTSDISQDFRIFVLGGTQVTADRACETLRSKRNAITAVGRSGYFDMKTQSGEIMQQIADFRPHLLLIGMGMPRQERFIQENFDAFPPAYIATVGGAVDYLAGAQRLAPRFFGRVGLEWLWRLGNDPRRLWRRYMVEPYQLAAIITRHRFRKTGAFKEAGGDAKR